MSALTKNYKDSLLENLKDSAEGAAYLDAALEDEDINVFLLLFEMWRKRTAWPELPRKRI